MDVRYSVACEFDTSDGFSQFGTLVDAARYYDKMTKKVGKRVRHRGKMRTLKQVRISRMQWGTGPDGRYECQDVRQIEARDVTVEGPF